MGAVFTHRVPLDRYPLKNTVVAKVATRTIHNKLVRESKPENEEVIPMGTNQQNNSGCLFPFRGDFLPILGRMVIDDEEHRRREDKIEEDQEENDNFSEDDD